MCTSPLKGFVIGETENGKRKLKVCSYSIDHLELWRTGYEKVPDRNIRFPGMPVVREFVEIPCGSCQQCRLDRARQWSERLLLEKSTTDGPTWFITLTYDNEHLPTRDFIDPDTGECGTSMTLVKKDVQDFWKRLRKRFGSGIRYFVAGEYGDHSARPHYHAIVFNLELDDLMLYKQTVLGDYLFTSDTLSRIWKKGFVVVGEATMESMAYTARYVLKKQYGKAADYYRLYNFEPEFTCMSLKPAIGRDYFDTNFVREDGSSLFDFDFMYISTEKGGKKIKPSRYYKKLYEQFDPENYVDYKERSAHFEEVKRAERLRNTSQDYLSMLDSEAVRIKANSRKLKRKEF